MSLTTQLGIVAALSAIVIGGTVLTARGKSNAERHTLSQQLMANRVPLALTLAGLAFAVLGFAMALHAHMSSTAEVDLAALQSGAKPTSSFIATEGVAALTQRYCSKGRGGHTSCYTPLWSAQAPRDRVAVVIHGNTQHNGAVAVAGYAGSEPQVHVRRGLEANGVELAEHARVLMVGETPDERVTIGMVINLAGLALLIGAVAWFSVRRRARK